MAEIVLITEDEFRKGEPLFRAAEGVVVEPAPAEEDRLAEAVQRHACRAAIVGAKPYRGPLYAALARAAAGRGAILARFGVGHDGIDKPLARQHGIVVTNTPGVLEASVAEHTIWLMGAVVRHVAALDAAMRAGQFTPQAGSELSEKLLGVVGFGAIGRRVAKMAHFGLGMRVWAADLRPAKEVEEHERVALAAWDLEHYTNQPDDIFQSADVVTLHLAANPTTRNFVDARRLALMKPTALLVNTARGSVVDEEALFDALSAGRIAGAALDVFQHEPYQPMRPDKDLRTLPNVVLTPHVASNTLEANARMAQAALENVRRFLAGRLEGLSRVEG